MSPAPLTRVEAAERAASVHVHGYRVELDLTSPDGFASTSRIHFHAAGPTWVDVRPQAVRRVVLDGVPLDLDSCVDPGAGRVRLDAPAGDHEVVVEALMAYSSDGEGLHRHVDPADGRTYLYAMSFLDAAPRWFACFDQPDLKAPVELDVRCPVDWRVAANGPATEVEPGHWTTAPTGPLATYFTTLVAGPYHEVRGEHDGVPLVLHARQSLAEHLDAQADRLLAHTAHCLDTLNGLFGVRYPWGEYHQAFVPDFNAGAMENPGCVTLRDQLVFRSRATDAELEDRDVTIAHEMAHMWFGDLVTMRWWDDLWLNESFAEYLGHRVTGEHTWPAFGIRRKSWGYAADRRPSTHPVAGNASADTDAALAAFDGISYAKGATVLRQLAARLGDDLFLAGLRDYIAAHAHGNATFDDLIGAWDAAGAVGLDAWAHAWLRTSGADTLSVDGDALTRTAAGDARRPHAIAVARYDRQGRELDRVEVHVDTDRTALPTAAPDGAELVLPDPDDRTWATIALPDWTAVPDALPNLDAPARVVVWNALHAAVAEARLAPTDALAVVAAAVADEPDHTLEKIGAWSLRTLATSVPPPRRADAAAPVRGAYSAVVDAVEPGSSRALAAFRVLVELETSVDALRRWLVDGPPAGLDLDHDVRWAVVSRLAALGALDADELAAEQRADPTSAGAVRAAFCRAATPTVEAKAAAWARLTGPSDASNYELYALAQGFWSASQPELTAPYVERYLAALPDLAARHGGFTLERLVELLYPWTAVADETLAATDAVLARYDLPAGVRRSVADGADDLRRALAARRLG